MVFTVVCLSQSVQAQAPLKVVVVEGEGAINNIRDHSAKAPVVRVENDDAQPVSGVTVTFVLPDMGASGYFENRGTTYTTTTDENGAAVARGLRPNNVAGRFQIHVRASTAGRSATAVITQINAVPAAAVRHGSNKKILIAALAAGGAAGAIFAAKGAGGKGGSTSAVTPGGTTVAPGSPVFGPPR